MIIWFEILSKKDSLSKKIRITGKNTILKKHYWSRHNKMAA